ncbi:MAG: ATP-binding protein [Candidatus Omnitrophota bacterium]
MDIEVLIKKSLVFGGMFAFVLGIFVSITLLVSHLIGGGKFISLAVSAVIITLLLRPIEKWLVNTTDKFLFQKKHEYKEILKAFIDEVITVLNLDEIINSTLDLLERAIHPYTCAIFILNRAEDKYQLYNSRGLGNKEVVFDSGSRLITFLKKSRQPAVLKQINGVTGVSPDIQREMAGLEAVVCLPLLLHSDLIGFISLGKKKSDLEYTKDDLDILLDLARTESIAVGNAQLLQEAAQSERRAAIGTMSAGINHEIGNPLNIINTKIQVFLVGIERGFYRDKSKEEIILECKGILNNTLAQTNRIADITKRLSNFAKPSKEFKPRLIDISEEIGEALAVVSHDLELEKIKIEKQISLELPKVLADKQAMQQVFFNLIRNAAQAIDKTGSITIKGVLTRQGRVHIEIEDTGKGIPDDKRHKIFEPFFTTKGPKGGTGLGLSIVRQLVWQNKGEISFRSQAGKGTTFILEFPRGAQL